MYYVQYDNQSKYKNSTKSLSLCWVWIVFQQHFSDTFLTTSTESGEADLMVFCSSSTCVFSQLAQSTHNSSNNK